MKMNMLAAATTLSDDALLARIHVLAGTERETTAELVAHIAVLDTRPSLYAARGYGSLFGYCTRALRLSEDATCNRIEAARACRRFPVILDLLASGEVSLTAVRLMRKHLTEDNHQAVLARASGRSCREIDRLVAELAPQPDVPASVRKLPTFAAPSAPPALSPATPPDVASAPLPPSAPSPAPQPPARRPIVKPSAPERYRVQFTIGEETHAKLRRVQALLRREIPDGDPGAIFDRALTLLLDRVERAKRAKADRPRPSIRLETDNRTRNGKRPSRHIPRHVQRGTFGRDGEQCTFVSADGTRCTEQAFLELHHREPHALGGPPTVPNTAVLCWRHNQYEAERVFGPHGTSTIGEPVHAWQARSREPSRRAAVLRHRPARRSADEGGQFTRQERRDR